MWMKNAEKGGKNAENSVKKAINLPIMEAICRTIHTIQATLEEMVEAENSFFCH